ncbi:pyridoxal phosphate-dependent aminotransferase [candidate division KSB1 bacterium]|nr:pyridoxal phosphate-dependent aminotransferase [candidate division KSB1 bacterium]RQW07655.1 MAG: pyridoxal phosphate-dependent aminotransferase [candidate division KSB1 bacterium]
MISQRSRDIPPFLVMDVLERAKALEAAGHPVIHMEVGEPDFAPPAKVKEAAIHALERSETHYTHSLGITPLRCAVADHYKRRYGVKIDVEQIVITQGTSPALLLVLTALMNPGDEIILANPGYACYPNFVRFIGGVVVDAPVNARSGFVLNVDQVKKLISAKTKAILINSPANPTGALMPPATLRELAELGQMIISDEIYHGLVYGEKEHSILEYTDRAFVLNGFSKYYAMTGFRLGYIIAPTGYTRAIQKTQQNLFICACSIAQWAGVSALNDHHPELDEMVKTYDARRRYLLEQLPRLGFQIAYEPKGAFYILADARHLDSNSHHLAFDILEKAHVALDPGIDFGSNAEGFLRFSYANSLDNIKTGIERLSRYIHSL